MELRGFEPLTFSEGQPASSSRRTSVPLVSTGADLQAPQGIHAFRKPPLRHGLGLARAGPEVVSADFPVRDRASRRPAGHEWAEQQTQRVGDRQSYNIFQRAPEPLAGERCDQAGLSRKLPDLRVQLGVAQR